MAIALLYTSREKKSEGRSVSLSGFILAGESIQLNTMANGKVIMPLESSSLCMYSTAYSGGSSAFAIKGICIWPEARG